MQCEFFIFRQNQQPNLNINGNFSNLYIYLHGSDKNLNGRQ
jgi:hypothetical protein